MRVRFGVTVRVRISNRVRRRVKLVNYRAHHHIRILYEFKFYVPHSTSDDVSSMFLVFLA